MPDKNQKVNQSNNSRDINHDRNGYNTKNDYEHSHGKHKPNKAR